MAERIGYAFYSEFERGYQVNNSPSFYTWDPAAAFLYQTLPPFRGRWTLR